MTSSRRYSYSRAHWYCSGNKNDADLDKRTGHYLIASSVIMGISLGIIYFLAESGPKSGAPDRAHASGPYMEPCPDGVCNRRRARLRILYEREEDAPVLRTRDNADTAPRFGNLHHPRLVPISGRAFPLRRFPQGARLLHPVHRAHARVLEELREKKYAENKARDTGIEARKRWRSRTAPPSTDSRRG